MERTITEEEKEIIINCGALGYDSDVISKLLMIDKGDIHSKIKNEDSEISKLYIKGKMMSEYLIDLKLFEMAKQGDLKALEKFEKRKRQR